MAAKFRNAGQACIASNSIFVQVFMCVFELLLFLLLLVLLVVMMMMMTFVMLVQIVAVL